MMTKITATLLRFILIILLFSFLSCDKQNIGEIDPNDTLSPCWSRLADMAVAKSWHCVDVADGMIYAIGGSPSLANAVEEYNPATDTWTAKSPMPTARWGLATAAINGKVYAIGGADVYPPTNAYQLVEEYDPVSDSWADNKSPMPVGRIAFTACSVDGKIYIPGGGGTETTYKYADVYMYDPVCDAGKD